MRAPTFTLPDQNGKPHSLSDYTGQIVLLYFYPKDDTPGCTTEACNFRDHLKSANDTGRRGSQTSPASADIQILGISCDSVESHKKFADKFKLNFPLLADTEKKVVNDYGVWVEKSMYGKKYMGIQRDSFLIDKNGEIIKH